MMWCGPLHLTFPGDVAYACTNIQKCHKKKKKNVLIHGTMQGCRLASWVVYINDKFCDIREKNVTIRSKIWTTNICSLGFRDSRECVTLWGLILRSIRVHMWSCVDYCIMYPIRRYIDCKDYLSCCQEFKFRSWCGRNYCRSYLTASVLINRHILTVLTDLFNSSWACDQLGSPISGGLWPPRNGTWNSMCNATLISVDFSPIWCVLREPLFWRTY